MKYLKLLILLMIALVLVLGLSAQTKRKSVKKAVKTKTVKRVSEKKMPLIEEYRSLARGSNSSVEEPFVFVARDKETYAHLKSLVGNLPAASEIDFGNMAVVAAFAGMKNTGGFSVRIVKSGEKTLISLDSPPPGAIVTEALTYPFEIVLVPVEEEKPLILEAGENWTKAGQNYRISSGEFEYSGGFAFRQKKFSIDGAIQIYRAGDLVTADFNLSGKGAEGGRKLDETVSGAMKNGKIELARLDVGSFSEGPKPPVKVTGTMTGDKLSLVFEPLPTNVADGFSASGKLEAVKSK